MSNAAKIGKKPIPRTNFKAHNHYIVIVQTQHGQMESDFDYMM